MTTIREIKSKTQIEAVKELHAHCFPDGSPFWDLAADSCAFGLYESGRMVAYAQASPSSHFKGAIYLARVGVAESHRGKKMQQFLTGIIEDWGRHNGFSRCVTDTAHHSIASMRSLIASGYKPFWPDHPWGLPYSIYWTKQLNN